MDKEELNKKLLKLLEHQANEDIKWNIEAIQVQIRRYERELTLLSEYKPLDFEKKELKKWELEKKEKEEKIEKLYKDLEYEFELLNK